MADGEKQIKYGDLESDFFGHSQELALSAAEQIPNPPGDGKSAGNTFMQAYFGHRHCVTDLGGSMDALFSSTRKLINEAGANFKDIDNKLASSIEKGE